MSERFLTEGDVSVPHDRSMSDETGFLETNGARIYHEVTGTGEPVLMVHAGVANLRMWDEQVAALRDAYRVIRHDTRGFGRTETDAVAFSNRADIAALLDHLGVASAHVVGLSRGGIIGLDFALEFPHRVRSLVVSGGAVPGYDAPGDFDASAFDEAERLLEAKDWAGIADWETRFWCDGPGQPSGRAAASVRERVHEWVLTTYQAEKEEGTPQPLDPPAAERLTDLRAPLLVIIGDLDEAETQAHCRYLASAVPGARLEVFEGAAHMVNLEQPERFNRLLRDFLDEHRAD
jgi:pimeloyl-ACP methyl ester carboxylesterase